jgi:hypothetical protein
MRLTFAGTPRHHRVITNAVAPWPHGLVHSKLFEKSLREVTAGTYCETAALCRSVRISQFWPGWKFKNEVIGLSSEENLSRSASFGSRSLL